MIARLGLPELQAQLQNTYWGPKYKTEINHLITHSYVQYMPDYFLVCLYRILQTDTVETMGQLHSMVSGVDAYRHMMKVFQYASDIRVNRDSLDSLRWLKYNISRRCSAPKDLEGALALTSEFIDRKAGCADKILLQFLDIQDPQKRVQVAELITVSYTHLTLPTIYSV